MIPPKLFAPDSAARPSSASPADKLQAFGVPFWLTYASNFSMMLAVSLLFRYADFVKVLGGDEWQLGLIAGVGMVGALVMRIAQGVGIDRLGPRQIWLWSSALFVVTCLGHTQITTLDSPTIYVLRILYQTSLAGFFGASLTFIAGRSPLDRIAEVVGALGSSGFLGMAVGSTLSDMILDAGAIDRSRVNQIFLLAAVMGSSALIFAALATRGAVHRAARRRPPLLGVLRRYHPGSVVIIAIVMGFGLGLPPIFLRPFVASLEIENIRVFFYAYTATAFVVRVSTRRLPDYLGVRRMVFLGLGALVSSMLLFLTVGEQWQLIWPGFAFGVAHAALFPSVVAAATAGFPLRYRGLGTTFILAMIDIGGLIGSPTVGGIVELAPRWGLRGFPTMFVIVAGLMTTAGIVYACIDRSREQDLRSGRITRIRRRSRPPTARVAEAIAS